MSDAIERALSPSTYREDLEIETDNLALEISAEADELRELESILANQAARGGPQGGRIALDRASAALADVRAAIVNLRSRIA